MPSLIKNDSSGVVVTALFLRSASPWRRELKHLIGQKESTCGITSHVIFPLLTQLKIRTE